MDDQATNVMTEKDLMWREVWSAYRDNPNDVNSRNRIIEHYMPLVRRRAERIRSRLPHEIEPVSYTHLTLPTKA